MSIQVVVSSTAAGVSVSGGTAVAITVGSTSASVPVTVGGGIGPAGFVVAQGTATNAFGTFQLSAGDGITISTSAGQFQIASYGTAAVASLAPVQSVAGRVGAVQLQASDVTAGTFAIARIPTISYTALSNTPATFSPSAHTHSTSDVVSFTAAAAAAAPVQSVAGRSGAVSLAVADVSGLAAVASSGSYTSLQNVPATFAPQAHTHGTADITGFSGTFAAGNHTHDAAAITSGVLELARIPTVGLTASFSQVGHSHDYVRILNGLTGTVTIAGGAGVTVSTASSSITIAAAGSYVLPTASSSVLGGIKVGSGLTITDGVLSRSSSYDPAAAPGAPTGISWNAGTTTVSWNASPGGVAVRYELQRSSQGTGTYTTISSQDASSGLSVNVGSLSLGTMYSSDKFRIRGLNADSLPGEWGYQEGATPGGSGGSANIVEATTAAGFPATGASSTLYVSTDASRVYRWSGSVYVEIGTAGGTGTDSELRALFIPAAPTSVTATGGNAQATVSWTAPAALSVLPITDYTVQYSSNSGSTWTTFTRAASAATSATVTGLTNGTAYVFKVSATNGVGTSSYSASSSAVTPAAAVVITYANKFGPGSYSVSGTGTITATVTGGGGNADTRLWLLVGTTGTLTYAVNASSEGGYDGGRLYLSSASPASHSGNPPYDTAAIIGLQNLSGPVSNSASSGYLSVTAGQYLVLRYVKDDGGDAGTDSITAVLSIS
jgi:hypothetical protein